MRYILLVLLLIPSALIADLTFGTGADKSKLVAISELLSKPSDYKDKTITVSGEITEVCKNKGCWMKFASDAEQQSLRIKVKDDVMVFPVSARGKKGYATGVLTQRKLTLEQTWAHFAHIAEEQGTDFDPKSITEPMVLFQLVPVGVTIED